MSDKLVNVETGFWASSDEIVAEAINELKANQLYKKDAVYRVIASCSEESIAGKLLAEGAYKKSDDLVENEFWADTIECLLDNYDTVGPFEFHNYIAVFNPEKVEFSGASTCKYNDPDKRLEALDALVEINYID